MDKAAFIFSCFSDSGPAHCEVGLDQVGPDCREVGPNQKYRTGIQGITPTVSVEHFGSICLLGYFQFVVGLREVSI